MTPFLLPGGATDVSSQARPETGGRCAKAGEKAAPRSREPQDRGSPAHSRQQGQSPAPPRGVGGRLIQSPSHWPDRAGPSRREWGPPAGRRGLDVLTRDWSPDGGSEGAGGERGNDPLPHTHHPGPRQATSSPVRPDRGASTPPLPPVPLGLPPGGRLPRWGPAASPATARALAPPRGGAVPGGGAVAEGAEPTWEQSAAGSPEGGDWRPGVGKAGAQSEAPKPSQAQSGRAVGPPASAETRKKAYLPSTPTGRTTAGFLVFSSPLPPPHPSTGPRTQQMPRNSDYL